MDPSIEKPCVPGEYLKCLHIGLLCVQEDAADRPTMTLPSPTRPAFSVGRARAIVNSITANEVTLSELTPR